MSVHAAAVEVERRRCMVTGIKPQLTRCFEIDRVDEGPSEFRRSALMKGAFTVQMGRDRLPAPLMHYRLGRGT